MVGHESLLCIVSMNGFNSYKFEVFNMKRRKIVHEGFLPIREHSQLGWIGFTNEGILAIMDAESTLSFYDAKGLGKPCWVPVFVPNDELSGAFWPVNIYGDKMAYVLCNEEKAAPAVHPPPVQRTITLSIPSAGTGQGDSEEIIIRDLLLLEKKKKEQGEKEKMLARLNLEKSIVRLFMEACNRDKGQRAYDLALLLELPATLRAALKFSQEKRQIELATRINALLNNLEAKKNKDSESEESEEESSEEEKKVQRPAKKQKTSGGSKPTKTITLDESDDESEEEDNEDDEEDVSSMEEEDEASKKQQAKKPAGMPFRSFVPAKPTGDIFSALKKPVEPSSPSKTAKPATKSAVTKQPTLFGASAPSATSEAAKTKGKAATTAKPKQKTLTGEEVEAPKAATRGRKRKQGSDK
eukprot:TRINITY_DN1441_c0_g1_i1.p1 TRINITY_DN1441_c0_g1~~TRINITY_DN1441_c0_g1_i1.p1  ORF type:complete len:412 (-),score=148.69 TRINITY_DN1441_c0_g1_i1:89-1324(-)